MLDDDPRSGWTKLYTCYCYTTVYVRDNQGANDDPKGVTDTWPGSSYDRLLIEMAALNVIAVYLRFYCALKR